MSPTRKAPWETGSAGREGGKHPDTHQLRCCNLRPGGPAGNSATCMRAIHSKYCSSHISHSSMTFPSPPKMPFSWLLQKIHTTLNKYLHFRKAGRRDKPRGGKKKTRFQRQV